MLERRDVPFDLLETLRWTPEESFFLLERHLDRLQQSARFFGYHCEIAEVRSALDVAVASAAAALRIRVLVSRDGSVRVEQQPLQLTADPLRVALATRPVDSSNRFLFHKTTNRVEQERERTAAYDEIILWNADRDVTEAMTANVVAKLDGRMITPPVSCGLLAGTMRAELLAAGDIEEGRIPVDRLADASSIWLINSVRGWRRAILARR